MRRRQAAPLSSQLLPLFGLAPDDSLRGRFVKASAAMEDGGGDEIKYNPNQLRDRDGKWGSGGFLAPDDGASSSGAWPKPPENKAQFATREAATDWLQNGFGDAYSQVEKREKAVVRGYKTFSFDSLNEILRTGDSKVKVLTRLNSSGEITTEAATLDQIHNDELPAFDRAISKFPLSRDLVAERVTDAPFWQGALQKGQAFQDPAYQSVTVWPEYSDKLLKKRQMAKTFEQLQLNRSGSNAVVPAMVTLEIHLREGQHALPMQPFERERAGKDDYQYELILPRNGKMIVKDIIEEKGKPKRVVLGWEQ